MIVKKNTRLWILFTVLFFALACSSINIEEQGRKVLDSIPVYEGASLTRESRTTYPDSSPSIIREYQSDGDAIKILEYYQSILEQQGWKTQVFDTTDPYVPREILAEKDNWQVSILIYSTGQFTLRIFLN